VEKILCLSYYLLCFLFNKIKEQEGRTGSARKRVGHKRRVGELGEVIQIMYTHVSKCKNDKIKERGKKKEREWLSVKRDNKFLLFLVNSWAQGVSAF
jgi:hypothetical protein